MSYGLTTYGSIAYGGPGSQNVAATTESTLTPTTTRAAIRDALVSAIEALTPKSLRSKGFRYSRHETADFRVWADDNDNAVFRDFVIEFDDWSPFGVSDGLIQRRETELTLIVAYPSHWALYAKQGDSRRALEDVLEEDLSQLVKTIGIHGSGNYPSGSCPKLDQTVSLEVGEGVTFGVIEVAIEYKYRL